MVFYKKMRNTMGIIIVKNLKICYDVFTKVTKNL